MNAQMMEQMQQALRLQSLARADKDPIKLSCIDNGLMISKALLNVGDEGLSALQAAIRTNNTAEQTIQFARIQAAADEAAATANATKACLGANQIRIADSSTPTTTTTSTTTDPGSLPPVMNEQGALIPPPPPPKRKNLRSNILGVYESGLQPLEYVAFASPFVPN